MIEIEAGEGYNDGPELRLLVQSDKIMALPDILATFAAGQTEIFSRYRREPSDYLPIFGRLDGFRFNDEWTFPEAS